MKQPGVARQWIPASPSVDRFRWRGHLNQLDSREIFPMFSGRARAGELAKSLAADSMTANLMVADTSCTIIYVNRALARLLAEAEADICKELPGFSAARLVGRSVDMF